MKKALTFALLLAALAASLFFMFFMEGEEGKSPELAAVSYLEDVRITNKKTGQLQWEILTKRVDLTSEGGIATMKGVAITLPREGMDVQAATGIYNMETSHLRLDGDVLARGENFTFRTGHVEIDSKKGEMTTDDDVLVEGKNFKVSGRGMRAAGQKIWLESDVNAAL
jgi:LPS export ABC transporter protein LptC